jgi:hypothetical protein
MKDDGYIRLSDELFLVALDERVDLVTSLAHLLL